MFKNTFFIYVEIVLVLFMVGFVLPYLISADSDEFVAYGFVVGGLFVSYLVARGYALLVKFKVIEVKKPSP